jgi:hypothetical protein
MARLMSDPELRDQRGARARERSEDFAPARIWAMWDRVIESVVG